jgi:penicillin-binding protein 1A
MAIKKNNNQIQNSDKNITYQKKFWKIFFYGMGAVGLFFLFASWGLLVRCLLLKI